jgi:hypothetical protein
MCSTHNGNKNFIPNYDPKGSKGKAVWEIRAKLFHLENGEEQVLRNVGI